MSLNDASKETCGVVGGTPVLVRANFVLFADGYECI